MPHTAPLLTIALLLATGAGVQWLAWRLRVPAILFLLLTGFLVGPILGWLQPELAFGELFRPLVSLSVGIILFEGGMTLRLDELRGCGGIVTSLVSLGALVTWGLTTLAGIYIAGVDFEIALLVGAILVLTGPTVVIPLVRHVRPRPPLGPILRWEGILIDPIGAVLALLVLQALTGQADTGWAVALGILRTLLFGGVLGLLTSWALARALERFIVPDSLHVPVTLGVVCLTFAIANTLQPEAGLLAVTVMGIVLANRSKLDIEHVAEWHEPLVTMMLAALFVTIAARLPLDTLTGLGMRAIWFTGALIVVIRPIAVAISTVGSNLNWRDRAFLMAMAPRGIVVAAVSSEFSLYLEGNGVPGSQQLVGLVFPAIVLTVLFYGFASRPIARLLGTAQADPQGVLMVGADLAARELGRALTEQGVEVLLVDTNHANTATARTSGLPTWQGSVLSNRFAEEADLAGIGHMLALTPSDEVNRLALEQFLPTFDRAGLFRIASSDSRGREEGMVGRELFHEDLDWEELHSLLHAGARIRATKLTEQFKPEDYKKRYGEHARPLFVLTADNKLQIVTTDSSLTLKSGTTILTLVPKGVPVVDVAAKADT